MQLSIVILAAGEGTRMRSALPKVLHPLAGKPLLGHVIDTARQLDVADITVVYGHGGERVRDTLSHLPVQWVEQAQRLGTGHAVAQALPNIPDDHNVLVLYGDVPLISERTLRDLLANAEPNVLNLLTAELPEPFGYGRIVRNDQGRVMAIVEEKDANESQRAIREINTGILAANAARLRQWVSRLSSNNAQGEYYLTDVIAMAEQDGVEIKTAMPWNLDEIKGVNNRSQLAHLERSYQRMQAEALMAAGVTLMDPARFDVRGTVETGRDVTIDVNVVLEGNVTIGEGAVIGSNCVIKNARIGAGVHILANTVIDDAVIGDGARVGPFARVRPETQLADNVHVGNFVEIKKARVGPGSKINHLSYVGDATVGRDVNIGAGTITCNYDGANKYQTVIGDRVFVGSDTQLVAPVIVGDDATIGAGSTITKDVPPGELTLSRSPQQTRKGWKRPVKKPKT